MAWADAPSDSFRPINGGYYLLHKLSDDEAQLPLLLDLKHAPAAIKAYADRVSQVAQATSAAIEQMHDADPRVRYDLNPLPKIECDIRGSIDDQKQHELLFGTHDGAFVRALLVSQIEASSYGLNIAKVLAGQDSNRARVKKLNRISSQWLALHDEAFHLLATASP